jgi:hypothetical protein
VIVTPLLFVLTPPFGLKGAALSMLIAISVTVIPEMAIYIRGIELSARELARSLAPTMLSAAVLAAALGVLVSQSSSMSPAASLGLVASIGLCVYVVATALFARSAVAPLWAAWRSGRG